MAGMVMSAQEEVRAQVFQGPSEIPWIRQELEGDHIRGHEEVA